jgi:hypothetical protein
MRDMTAVWPSTALVTSALVSASTAGSCEAQEPARRLVAEPAAIGVSVSPFGHPHRLHPRGEVDPGVESLPWRLCPDGPGRAGRRPSRLVVRDEPLPLVLS